MDDRPQVIDNGDGTLTIVAAPVVLSASANTAQDATDDE